LGGKPGLRPHVKRHVLRRRRVLLQPEEFEARTLIGEKTGGGAHPVSGHRIDDHFMIGVPFARAINPSPKRHWEGTGVEPDVKVPAADALTTAQKTRHEKLNPK